MGLAVEPANSDVIRRKPTDPKEPHSFKEPAYIHSRNCLKRCYWLFGTVCDLFEHEPRPDLCQNDGFCGFGII